MERTARRELISRLLAEEVAEQAGDDDSSDLATHWIALIGVQTAVGDGEYGWVCSAASLPEPTRSARLGLVHTWLSHDQAAYQLRLADVRGGNS